MEEEAAKITSADKQYLKLICGEIFFDNYNLELSLVCAYCDEEVEQLESFLLHVLLFHINVTKNEVDSLIKSAINKKNDSETLIEGVQHLLTDDSEAAQESIGKIKCGKIFFVKEIMTLTYKCSACNKEIKTMKTFLYHSLISHLKVSESVVNAIGLFMLNEKESDHSDSDIAYSDSEMYSLEEVSNKSYLESEIHSLENELNESDLDSERDLLEEYDSNSYSENYSIESDKDECCNLSNKSERRSLKQDDHIFIFPFDSSEEIDTITEDPIAITLQDIKSNFSEHNSVINPDFCAKEDDSSFQKQNKIAEKIRERQSLNNKEKNILKKLKKPKRCYTCEICGLDVYFKSDFIDHRNRHLGVKQFECNICNKAFVTKEEVKRHKKVHLNPGIKHKCKICKKYFKSANELALHGDFHLNEGRQYFCEVCGSGFKSEATLNRHSLKHVKDADHSNAENKVEGCNENKKNKYTYICDLCGKKCINASSLKTHYNRHNGIKPFKCPECGREFYLALGLKRHIRIHSDERPYKCNLCGKAFKSFPVLNMHCKTHTKDRKFECLICGARFYSDNKMKKHFALHDTKRAFPCPECDLSFKVDAALKRHFTIYHTDNKPFECIHCKKKYTKKQNYDNHIKKHKNDNSLELKNLK